MSIKVNTDARIDPEDRKIVSRCHQAHGKMKLRPCESAGRPFMIVMDEGAHLGAATMRELQKAGYRVVGVTSIEGNTHVHLTEM